jgi:outer membrane protein, multidrug efflux system
VAGCDLMALTGLRYQRFDGIGPRAMSKVTFAGRPVPPKWRLDAPTDNDTEQAISVKRSWQASAALNQVIFVKTALAVVGVLSLLGCSDIRVPQYQRPQAPEKTSWSRANILSPAEAISPQWWTQFGDPTLDSLVAEAISGNIDLKILVARITTAKAQIAESRAGSLPTVDVTGGELVQKTLSQPSIKQYSVGTQVSWDLDLWGKVQKGVEAQTAEFHATEADWRAGYLQIVANVGTTYFQIRQLDEQIDQQQHALARNQQILTIYQVMRSNGLAPASDVARQQAEIHRLTTDLLELHRSRDVTENALATLVGVPAGEFKLAPAMLQDRVLVPPVPGELPLDLLARRPDVVAAEFRVLEAHDLMGQARLAQLPTVNIAGQAGIGGLALTDFLKALTLSFTPTIDIPALNPGVRAHVKTTEAQVKVAEESYRRTVIVAYEEVESALVNLESHRQQEAELQKQVDQLKSASAQLETQLKLGVISQLDVFEDERSLLAARLALLASHEQVLSDTLALYKALGGGWTRVEVANAR